MMGWNLEQMSLPSGEAKRRKKKKLYREQKGKCYYCPTIMDLVLRVEPHNQWDTLATFEHLNDKWDPKKRRRPCNGKEKRIVLACHRCNQRRNDLTQTFLSMEV